MTLQRKKILKSAAILLVGGLISWLLFVSKPAPEPEDHHQAPPHIAELVTLEKVAKSIVVTTQGTVTPKTEIEISAQVTGQVVSVGEHFAAGGFFEAGETLLTIDPRDYEIAVAKAEATLADALKTLAQEQGQALQAQREWRDLGNDQANELFLRKPQVAAARANVAAAEAGVRQAKLNLERTAISVPFDGRVVEVSANLGQFVVAGAKVGRVYASDVMEVRLPLSVRDMGLLNLKAGQEKHQLKPMPVTLGLEVSGQSLQWKGQVVRVEASADTKSRLFYVVAEVTENDVVEGVMPLLAGIFVEARISSNPYEGVFELPRSALYKTDQVMVLDEENRLRIQPVEVLQVDSESLVVRGLSGDEQVLSKPPGFIELGAVYTVADSAGQVNES